MQAVINLSQTVFKIRQKLLKNSILRKLLLHTGADALNGAEVSIEDVESLMLVTPYVDMEKTEGMNNFIVVHGPALISNDDYSYDLPIHIDVVCDIDYYILNNQRIRPYEIMSLIINDVIKLNSPTVSKITFISFEQQEITEEGKIIFTIIFEALDDSDTEI